MSAGLHCDGTHAGMIVIPPASVTALILRNTNSSCGRDDRPLHAEYSDTVESNSINTRLHSDDGYDNNQCRDSNSARNSSWLMCGWR